MFSRPPAQSGDGPLTWIELFDHSAGASLDGCGCREIEDALSAFDTLVAQAEAENAARRPQADDAI